MLTALLAADPAAAAATAYGSWSMSGQSGTLSVPVSGFPSAQVSTTSTSVQVPSGASSYLNATTPFGAAFGSSQNKPYLVLRTASGLAPSTTTLSFASPPTPGSWGFALGDVDADMVQVSATDQSGRAVPVADLGFQSTFNYCNGSPLPSACAGSTSTDQPVWDSNTGTLTGNVVDTNGASGWFRPRVRIKTLSLRFSMQTGIPVYQLWVAAEATTPPPVKPPVTLPVPPPVVVDPGTPTVIVVPPVIDHRRPVEIIAPPKHGTTSQLGDGNLLYTPNPGYTGPDSFTFRGRTKSGQMVTQTVRLDVERMLPTTGAGQTFPLLEVGGGLVGSGAMLATGARLRTSRRNREE